MPGLPCVQNTGFSAFPFMADPLVFTPSFLQKLAHQDVARALLEDVGAGARGGGDCR
jgi:hypothetical protein